MKISKFYSQVILGSVLLSSAAMAAPSADLCVAQKFESVNYSSFMKYVVNCSDNTTFDSPKMITTFLLPIPYHWGNATRRKLNTMMEEKGYNLVAKVGGEVSENSNINDAVIVYSKTPTDAEFCVASESNHQKIGMNQQQDIYDYGINCSKRKIDVRLKAITRAELGTYMSNLGVKFKMFAPQAKNTKNLMLVFEEIK